MARGVPRKGEFGRAEAWNAAAAPASMRAPRRSGRVAEGGALLRRYRGTNLYRGFESLLLRLAAQDTGHAAEGWQSGRMRRSRKPLSVVRRIESSNLSPSAFPFTHANCCTS